jgi:hypothetical protein
MLIAYKIPKALEVTREGGRIRGWYDGTQNLIVGDNPIPPKPPQARVLWPENVGRILKEFLSVKDGEGVERFVRKYGVWQYSPIAHKRLPFAFSVVRFFKAQYKIRSLTYGQPISITSQSLIAHIGLTKNNDAPLLMFLAQCVGDLVLACAWTEYERGNRFSLCEFEVGENKICGVVFEGRARYCADHRDAGKQRDYRKRLDATGNQQGRKRVRSKKSARRGK